MINDIGAMLIDSIEDAASATRKLWYAILFKMPNVSNLPSYVSFIVCNQQM